MFNGQRSNSEDFLDVAGSAGEVLWSICFQLGQKGSKNMSEHLTSGDIWRNLGVHQCSDVATLSGGFSPFSFWIIGPKLKPWFTKTYSSELGGLFASFHMNPKFILPQFGEGLSISLYIFISFAMIYLNPTWSTPALEPSWTPWCWGARLSRLGLKASPS